MIVKMINKVDDLSQRIGARVRAERQQRGWSLTELAQRSGVSRAMLHKVEGGDSNPTANLMARLAGALGMSMSALIARAELAEGRLLRSADQPMWTDPQTGYRRRHVSPRTDLPLDLVSVMLPAGRKVAIPAATYAGTRQLIWVFEGRLTFWEGGSAHLLEESDCLELGAPADCVFHNDTTLPCRYAVVVLRGGVVPLPAS